MLSIISGTSFQPVLGAIDCVDPKSVKKVVLVSGKHFFTLEAKRRELSRNDIAIIRLEQLCPFPVADLAEALRPFQHVKNFVWAQEEGRNMGPWTFVATRIKNFLNIEVQKELEKRINLDRLDFNIIYQTSDFDNK